MSLKFERSYITSEGSSRLPATKDVALCLTSLFRRLSLTVQDQARIHQVKGTTFKRLSESACDQFGWRGQVRGFSIDGRSGCRRVILSASLAGNVASSSRSSSISRRCLSVSASRVFQSDFFGMTVSNLSHPNDLCIGSKCSTSASRRAWLPKVCRDKSPTIFLI